MRPNSGKMNRQVSQKNFPYLEPISRGCSSLVLGGWNGLQLRFLTILPLLQLCSVLENRFLLHPSVPENRFLLHPSVPENHFPILYIYPKSKPYTLKTSANLDEHMTQCPSSINKKNLTFFDIVSPQPGFEPGPPNPQVRD